MRYTRYVALTALAATTLSACATKGFVRRGLEEQRVALGQERSDRVMGDSANRADVGVLRTDMQRELAALKADLGTLRTEYGTQWTDTCRSRCRSTSSSMRRWYARRTSRR